MPFHLESPRLILRPFTEQDIEPFAAYRSDPDISRYQGWEIPYTLEKAAAFVNEIKSATPGTSGEWYQLAMEIKSTGEMIGDIAFKLLERQETCQAEIGITLAKAYHGQGYASEASKALLEYLFEQLQVHRVFANIDPRNTASTKVLQRLGFRHEGRFIESLWFQGGWVDEDWYAMLQQEWKSETLF